MKFIDLFAGIGGIRMGLEQAGHECVGFAEIDKYARKSYEEIFDTEGEWTAHDITHVADEDWQQFRGTVDLICGGFPCQSFSVAGKRKGFSDIRGTMFFEIARAAKQIKPRFLLLENVKGLLSHSTGKTFAVILNTLDELGYDAEWQVLNSKNFGVPQNRERVFIIGHLRGRSTGKVFPITGTGCKNRIRQVGSIKKDRRKNPSVYRTYSADGIMPTLTKMDGGGRQPFIDLNPNGKTTEVTRCLTARYAGGFGNKKAERSGVILPNASRTLKDNKHDDCIAYVDDCVTCIRKLTPKECWRLQGFPDWAFEKASKVNSDTQLYKQSGNSVTVTVIKAIGEKLKELERW